jgi:isoprenylcysteine carboxyl methyltransferase (ICMT) family protein YpbQ
MEATTPSNLEYMILGYAAAGIIMALTVAYLILKARRIRQEAELLKRLEDDQEQ